MVSIDRLTYVVNTHKGKKRFKDINHAVDYMNMWREINNSYLSAFMTVEINRGLHKKKAGI